MIKRLAIFTNTEHPELPEEEQYLLEELPRRGIRPEPLVWDAHTNGLEQYDGFLVRAVWGYFQQMNRFAKLLDQLNHSVQPVWNTPAWLRWNSHKFYLQDLAKKGIPIVPTVFVKGKLDPNTLKRASEGFDAGHLVVKPAVSAGSHQTERLATGDPLPESFDETEDWLLQPYLSEIETEGEWSFVFFNGQFSHAVKKVPASGDFRVQKQFGGQYHPEQPSAALLQQARQVLRVLPANPLLARVDGILRDGQLLLMELELIEPDLYLYRDEDKQRFMDAISACFSPA